MRIFLFANGAKTKVSPFKAAATGTTITTTTATASESKRVMPILTPRISSDLAKSLRIAKGLFASFMLFALCWLPYGIIVMTDFPDRLPRTAHMFSMAIAHLNSAFNPLLYAIFNPAFQRGYKLFFQIIFLSRIKESPVSNTKPSAVVSKQLEINIG
jgi:hypothetical protein